MQSYAAGIETLEDVPDIFDFLWKLVRRQGAINFSYHMTSIFESQTSREAVIFTAGFSPETQQAYFHGGYRELDPIPRLAFEFGPVLTWAEAMRLGASDPQAEVFFESMRRGGYINGVSMALFGPRNRAAFSSIGFDHPPVSLEEGVLSLLHGLLQVAHMRICKILDDEEQGINLSDRERQVLLWMAKGKSGNDIATILDISPETVRTYTRRIYEKLDVADRVAATVKALKLGLIEA